MRPSKAHFQSAIMNSDLVSNHISNLDFDFVTLSQKTCPCCNFLTCKTERRHLFLGAMETAKPESLPAAVAKSHLATNTR